MHTVYMNEIVHSDGDRTTFLFYSQCFHVKLTKTEKLLYKIRSLKDERLKWVIKYQLRNKEKRWRAVGENSFFIFYC